ncbi:efflux RND transporter periplasmic adaptor subunit [Roseateles sp.]|uniref:efflux RND transporter periplasmic adaptor subunit n=1 Tax=Roseateles sp. TaxID=1971397 RepID=UPI002F3ED3E2
MTEQAQDRGLTTASRASTSSFRLWAGGLGLAVVAAAAMIAVGYTPDTQANAAPAPLPVVGVSAPLQRAVDSQLTLLGQYAAVNRVELRAQVGGTLAQIHFKDGDLVHKGDLLFVIDPEPYEIKLSQAQALLAAANARLDLATRQLTRAETLKATDAGSAENVEQRHADKLAAAAAVDGAQAQVRDARFDLAQTRVVAPFTGRIGDHQVSIGNLVAGSRGGTSPTTLLTTLVSLDPIYLNFDMSEADYTAYARGRGEQPLGGDRVAVSLGDSADFGRDGTLNFIDNALDRSRGTIHARAVVSNKDLHLTPGGFARVRLSTSKPQPVLLVPDASVLPDQSSHFVLTVGKDGTVEPKTVQIGELRGSLRVIRAGLATTDSVVVEGVPVTRPGTKVSPKQQPIVDDTAPAQAKAGQGQGQGQDGSQHLSQK